MGEGHRSGGMTTDIQFLANFKCNTNELLKTRKRTKHSLILKVNGSNLSSGFRGDRSISLELWGDRVLMRWGRSITQKKRIYDSI